MGIPGVTQPRQLEDNHLCGSPSPVCWSLVCARSRPPPHRASDASLKRVVASQSEKFAKAIERFDDRVDEIDTNAQLERAKTETERLSKVTGTFHTKVKGEQAASTKNKRARTKLLDALSTYKEGLDKLVEGIEDKSKSKILLALENRSRARTRSSSPPPRPSPRESLSHARVPYLDTV